MRAVARFGAGGWELIFILGLVVAIIVIIVLLVQVLRKRIKVSFS